MDDIEFLRHRMPDVKNVIGEITSWRTALVYGRKTVNGRITGANWEYGETRKHYPQRGGRFINAADERDKRRVIFIGDEMAKEIFGEEDPVGKTLLVNNSPYTVIGVMQYKRQMGMYGGPDSNHGIIPITTFRAQFGRDGLSNILIETHRPEEMKAALHSTFSVLGSKYSFDPEDERTFGTWDTVETGEVMNKVTLGIQLFLGIIGALTLLIGGVGVANIMYAVVKERTREIGVKMALGARGSWITGPFVLEGLVYTLIGGALGISIATLVVTGLSFIPLKGNQVLEFLGHPTLSWQIGIGTAAILGLIGVLAGYFPARRASSIDPAATLRYE
jgi:putative ABC transport system permease protein